MDDPNITIKEYIMLEEKKARRRGKVYNWETTTYGKIWDNEDVYDLGSVETEFPAIVFNNMLKSEATLSCEPTPTVSYFDDLDFFNDFENEFPAIVYNDALTSKLDFLTEPTVSPQHIDEFNLKDETSLFECDEEEQNVLNFNDLFPFNVIYPNDSKSDKDNDDDKVDIKHSSGDLSVKPLPDVINTDVGAYAQGSNKLLETISGQMTHFVASPTLDSAISCVMQGASCTQRKVSMVSFGRISPNSFLSSILLVVVIIVTVVIVVVILIVVVVAIVGVIIVVVIFGVVVVVDGVSLIFQFSFMIIGFLHRIASVQVILLACSIPIGWAYAFHQDKASLVRVPVANVTLSSSAHLLRENTDSVLHKYKRTEVHSSFCAYESRSVPIGIVRICHGSSYCAFRAEEMPSLIIEEEDGEWIRFLGGNSSSGTKKYQGSNSSDGGNTGDGVKITGGVIGFGDEIEFSEELKELLPNETGK
ncbi:hypothetical protein Tco_0098613 [Tanacetum coccineum]